MESAKVWNGSDSVYGLYAFRSASKPVSSSIPGEVSPSKQIAAQHHQALRASNLSEAQQK